MLRKIIVPILIVLPITFFITKGTATSVESSYKPAQPLAHWILTEEGKPMQSLERLLTIIPLEQLKGIPADQITLQQLVDATQKEWLRKPGSERWQIEEKFPELRTKIIGALDEIGLFTEIKPSDKKYSYCLILGATVQRVRTRLAYAIALYNAGIHFDRIIFLGGQRPLDANIESAAMLVDPANGELSIRADWQQPAPLPTTEYGMMKLVYDQADMPAAFASIPVTFIDSPMQQKPDGTLARPTTGDTIKDWLATEPKTGSCLFISNQPYVGYQDAVARTFMPATFGVETVGPRVDKDDELVAVLLDTMARWLYQENVRGKLGS